MNGVAWGVEKTADYEPIQYDPAKLQVPGFLPDTPMVPGSNWRPTTSR